MSEELRFDGRVVVVTGAGRGLGAAHARLLAQRGASVVVNDLGGTSEGGSTGDASRSKSTVDEITAAGGTAIANSDDVATDDGARRLIESAIDAFGRVDAVVNNAGNLRTESFVGTSRATLERTLAVHVLGSWAVSQFAWEHFAKQGYGRIVLTTSVAGLYGNAEPPMAAYCAAKGAVYGLMRALAAEGVGTGIQVNAVAPRAFTPMTAEHMSDPEQVERLMRAQPPEAVSPIVALLAHERCPLNGEVIFAGAGRLARPFMAETAGIDSSLTFSPEWALDHLDDVLRETDYSVPIPYIAPKGMQ